MGKWLANRNVLRNVQILGGWVFVVDVTRGVEAWDVLIGWEGGRECFPHHAQPFTDVGAFHKRIGLVS